MDVKLLKFVPSEIAAGAVYLARFMSHQNPIWTPTLEYYTTLSEVEAKAVAFEINALIKRIQKSNLHAIPKKYSTQKMFQVSLMPLINL